MKRYLYKIATLCLGIGLFSCNSYDEPTLNPNEDIGNPDFTIAATTKSFPQTGGNTKIDIATNTIWWTVKSNKDWLTAPTDTLYGSSGFDLNIPANNTTDTRVAVLTFQSGTKGPKSSLEISQKGLPSNISVSTNQINADGYGGEFVVNITSNATWTVTIENVTGANASWVSTNETTGFGNKAITVKIAKNVDLNIPSLEANITISVADESQVVNVKQIGNAASDAPNNTAKIYFNDFNPASDAPIGSIWTLTDPRDEQSYRVKLMADKRIWMIDDLRFAGDIGNQKTDLTIFNGNGDANKGVGIPNYWGDVANPQSAATSPKRGYFYNWQAVMQTEFARSAGGYSSSIIVESPYQGIAPDGWQVPSIADFETLKSNITSSDWASVWEVVYGGHANHGDVKYGGLKILSEGAFGAYYTITQKERTDKTGSSKNNFIGTWNITPAGDAKAVYSGSVTTESANRNYGYAVRLLMQQKQ